VGAAGSVLTLGHNASTTPITILPGFSTTLASSSTGVQYPFGLWFANDHTLYVADEGDGSTFPAPPGGSAGLEKWVLENDGKWHNVYTLSSGLVGVGYTISGYPSSSTPQTIDTDGLRSLTGRLNGDGTVTLWAVTSTVRDTSATGTLGDFGADPDELVTITDRIDGTSGTGESFRVLRTSNSGEVLRGVAFVEQCHGSGDQDSDNDNGHNGHGQSGYGNPDDHGSCDQQGH